MRQIAPYMESFSSPRTTVSALLSERMQPGPSDSPSGCDGPGDSDGEPPSRGSTSPRLLATSDPGPLLAHSASRQQGSRQAPIQEADVEAAGLSLENPLARGVGWAGGVLIALLTAIVPLASVVVDREGLAVQNPQAPPLATGALPRQPAP